MTIFRKKGIEEIEPKKAFIEIEKHRNNPNFVIIDARSPKEYEKDHLENAHLLDVNSNDFQDKLEKLDKENKYFVYCKAGKRGCKAVEIMKETGFKEVHNIAGGIDKWKAKRLPVTND